MPYSAYGWLADSLVKYGYILAFPTTESSFSPNHLEFGKDIAFLCQRITSLNDSAASFLFGKTVVEFVTGTVIGGKSHHFITGIIHFGLKTVLKSANHISQRQKWVDLLHG